MPGGACSDEAKNQEAARAMASLKDLYEPRIIQDGDDVGSNPSSNPPLLELAKSRMSRRAAIKGFASAAVVGAIGGTLTSRVAMAANGGLSSLGFEPLMQVIKDTHQVAPGYTAEVLIRWGDKVMADAPEWDATSQSAAAQGKQFGYNNDYLAYFPLPRGSDNSEHGLLHANFEYTIPQLMFAGWVKPAVTEEEAKRLTGENRKFSEDELAELTAARQLEEQTPEQTRIEMMAHGGGIIEIRKENGRWRVVPDSKYARRITAETEMAIAGPAAGHDRLKTNYDPTGTRVRGTFNNCAGGKTPWGTVLMAEENFHGYFGGTLPENAREKTNHERYGVPDTGYPWSRSQERFDVGKEPNEPNRYGWIVEYDPYDPSSTPTKRTALGRFKHEGGTCWVNKDGRLVLYSGDDERFEYLYRYVSNGIYDPHAGAGNSALLDDGTLYVARFDEDKVNWLPIVFGEGPLTRENGFASQADVLIETRRAADLLGATPLDRPEDVEPNPVNGRVYVMLTNNSRRKMEQVDAANPRAENLHGQVVELIPPGGEGPNADHAAGQFDWQLFLLAGNPSEAGSGAKYHGATQAWISSPDNCAFDSEGRLWISTDQGSAQRDNNIPDGMYVCDVSGDGRGLLKFFFGAPRDAEMCGPEFTPDGRTLFVAPQHPAEAEGSTFETPSTRWPDFAEGVPPRPSIVVITKDDGGEIGT
jgi:uncharacterized protein